MGRKNKRKTNRVEVQARNCPPLGRPQAGSSSPVRRILTQRGEISKPGPAEEPLLLPEKPDMVRHGTALRPRLFEVPAKERTVMATRLVRAYDMIDEIEKLQEARQVRDPERHCERRDIGELASDGTYVQECALWIRAYVSSDFRVGVSAGALDGSPLPSCWTHITSLRPLEENKPQLMNMDVVCFVILLATAIRLMPRQERGSLHVVHELHAHAKGGWLDFDELNRHGETKGLDEAFLRFALASVGVKQSRTLYRRSVCRSILLVPFSTPATKSKTLLRSIETFAEEQRRYMPSSPVGHWNLSYVTSQVKHNGLDPWRAAAIFLDQMAECWLLADAADDDFYRAVSGVEFAMAMVHGGKPLVAYRSPSRGQVQILRDIVDDSQVVLGKVIPLVLSAETPKAAREATAKEVRRQSERVPPTKLEEGETVIVPPWDVKCIWNNAMEAFMRLDRFGHGGFVYAESAGWDIVEEFLIYARDNLAPMQYYPCPQVGFALIRDKGSWPCEFCGTVESDLKVCSVCKRAQYCSRECQTKAWKTHRRVCIPVQAK
ncbi:hypothetical protein ACHAWF_005149 [Thalassiosira exigua]